MKIFRLLCIAMAILVGTAISVFAQNPSLGLVDQIFPESGGDQDMKPLKADREPFSVSYGGWLMPVYMDDKQGANRLTSSLTTLKLWGKSTLGGNSFLYLRGKESYFSTVGSNGRGGIYKDPSVETTKNVVDLDVGMISLTTDSRLFTLAMGRKYFLLGTGLVFNGRGDGAEFVFNSKYVDIKLFSTYTGLLIKDNNPYSLSDKDYSDGAKRLFSGGTIETEFSNQTLYIMALSQLDRAKERVLYNGTIDHTRYNSNYIGAGMTGTISDFGSYYGELVYENGTSHQGDSSTDPNIGYYGTEKTQKINAYAATAGINFYINTIFNPSLNFQYAYGSGNSGRTNTRDPRTSSASLDTGFLSFGTFNGGMALRPQLSNIHIYRAGFTITPLSFAESRMMRRINLSAKYSLYRKDKRAGIINFGEASNPNSKEIGQGVDTTVRWGIFSDLSVFATYGIFLPGRAYNDPEATSANGLEEYKKDKQFLMAGFNLIF